MKTQTTMEELTSCFSISNLSFLFFLLSYECHVFGQSFQLQWGNFTQYRSVRCHHTAEWSLSQIEEQCKCNSILLVKKMHFKFLIGSHCVNPPTPPSIHNLRLDWNERSPPMHNQTVTYTCNAGNPWNRFEHDFSQNSMTLKCLPENQFEEVEWPNCKADILCPNPTSLENETFALYDAVANDLNFNQTAK